MTREEHVELSKNAARDRIASASALIERIETHGMRFYEQLGDGPMREITDETLVEQRQIIERNNDLLRMYESDGG